jgi:hypothetical protein
MKKSVRVLSVLLGCASIAAISTNALAAQPTEPELQFYPAEKWSVNATDQLCTIKATFNNGFTVRLLGNERWVRALDVDFRQDILTSGDTYDATLTIPGIATKTFKASAQSSSLLAFGIGNDKSFYKSLKQSAVLDVSLDDNQFRFIMTGFGNHARNFESCMADVSAFKVSAQQAPEEQQNFMVNEAISMEESIKTAEAPAIVEITPEDPKPVIQEIPYNETKKVGDITVSASEAVEPVTGEAQDMSEVPSHAASNQKKRLSQQLAEQIANDPSLIEVDDDQSASFAEKQRKPLEVPEDIAAMPIVPAEESAPVTPLAEPQQPPQDDLEAPQEIAVVTPEPEEEIAEPEPVDLIKETEEVEVEVETVKVVETIENDLPVPEEELEVVTIKTQPMKVNRERMSGNADFTADDPNGLSNVNEQLRKDVISLEATLRQLKAENTALNAELKSALRESEEERLSISSENWNLERATMQYNEAERQIKRLGQQLQQERAKCSLEKRDLEAMLFDPQVTEQAQMARLTSLEGQLAKAQRELEAQRIRYEERIRLMESTQ